VVRLASGMLAALALAGCATTQEEAARLQLNDARLRASAVAVRVTGRNPAIAVQRVVLLEGRTGSALVVRLHNRLGRPVSDLPISIGLIGARGVRTQLNGRAGLGYFLTHIPAVAPLGMLTWVFTTSRRLPTSARPFAVVGRRAAVGLPSPLALPVLSVLATSRVASRGRGVVTVRDQSAVPQYGLQLYAVAERHGRFLAAGRASIAHLSNGQSKQIQVHLVGAPSSAPITFQAPPTIFK
jgi:hypothetical protein